MFRQITIVTCDLCGKRADPKPIYNAWNEPALTIPDGWTVARGNTSVHLCAECTRKLEGRTTK